MPVVEPAPPEEPEGMEPPGVDPPVDCAEAAPAPRSSAAPAVRRILRIGKSP
jgi:hypothetical protein